MLRLHESTNAQLQFLLGSRDYAQQYALLKKALGADIDFFAEPNKYGDTTRWSLENDQVLVNREIRSFSELSDEDKDTIADYIEDKKAAIAPLLAQHPVFEKDYEQLFLVPDESSIKVVRTEMGLQAVLTEWACQSSETTSTIDPVGYTIQRPRKTTALVLIEVFYTDGTPATDKPFFIDYLGRSTQEKTTPEGNYNRGRCKIDSTFTVYEQSETTDQQLHPQTFTVHPEGEYKVYFPFITSGKIKVIDQQDQPVPEVVFNLDLGDAPFSETSNHQGMINLVQIESGKTLQVKEQAYPENQQAYNIQKQGNDFLFKIHRPIKVDKTVKVINQHEEIQIGHPITLRQNDEAQHYTTNESGIVVLESLEVDKTVKIIDQKNPANFIAPLVTEETEEYILKITTPEKRLVTVLLLGYKKEPLPNIPIDFTYQALAQQGAPTTLTTSNGAQPEEQGKCTLPYEDFEDKEKVKALIHLPKTNRKKEVKKDKNGKPKEKLIQKKFTFKAEQQAYTIRLRRRPWWLLLLLLLPLLLLIQCEKEVYVKVLEAGTQTPIAKAQTSFTYQKAALFDFNSGRFFTNDTIPASQKTDTNGVAGYYKLKYTIYSYLFKSASKALVLAYGQNCYGSDTLQPRYHGLQNKDTLVLQLAPAMIPLDFKAVDAEDLEPLPGTKVEIIAEFNGKIYRDTSLTEADGRVIFSRIPRCGQIKRIFASKQDYHPDSLLNRTVDNLLAGTLDSTRRLKLRPMKERIKFEVTNCETKEPIPNAQVNIDFIIRGKKKRINESTNTNGIGKGHYDSAYVNAEFVLEAAKRYYQICGDGRSRAKGIVKNFKDKVIKVCLCPQKLPLELSNCDESNGKRLSGVKNVVIVKRNGRVIRTDTLMSNGNGKFLLSDLRQDDLVTVISYYPPYYKENRTKIKDVKVKDLLEGSPDSRQICLESNRKTLGFTNCDASNNQGLPGVKNIITIKRDGKVIKVDTIVGSIGGRFLLKDVLPEDEVTIIATYPPDYKENNTTVKDQKVKDLLAQGGSVRICLEPDKEPKEPQVNCRAFFTGGLAGGNIEEAGISQIFNIDDASEYVGKGDYPNNKTAFPKAVARSFDGIAIDKNTRVIIYSQPNFQGEILLDKTGPAVINNVIWKNDSRYNKVMNQTFPPALQAIFPPSVREWSSSDMHKWSYGSVKIICKK
ncbi:MAG TPA: hypothetical protein DCS93_07095 [Microscillaceae bacterium]|nr:hypothetical protein [Microscillaceae bacterium]